MSFRRRKRDKFAKFKEVISVYVSLIAISISLLTFYFQHVDVEKLSIRSSVYSIKSGGQIRTFTTDVMDDRTEQSKTYIELSFPITLSVASILFNEGERPSLAKTPFFAIHPLPTKQSVNSPKCPDNSFFPLTPLEDGQDFDVLAKTIEKVSVDVNFKNGYDQFRLFLAKGVSHFSLCGHFGAYDSQGVLRKVEIELARFAFKQMAHTDILDFAEFYRNGPSLSQKTLYEKIHWF